MDHTDHFGFRQNIIVTLKHDTKIMILEKKTFFDFYQEDTFIVTQGSEPDALYFTLSGVFHAISHANAQAPQRLLGRIEAGQFVGDITLFDPESTASASVKAMKNASTLRITPDSFKAFCETHPAQALELVSALARGLAARLRLANEKVL